MSRRFFIPGARNRMQRESMDRGLTPKQERAAALLAEGLSTKEHIAERLRVQRPTLWRWEQLPAFAARVEEHLAVLREKVREEGIANRMNRVAALNDRWHKMKLIIDQRAADEVSGAFEVTKDAEGATERHVAPGWDTGLLVRQEKQIGAGANAVRVVEFAVDTGLLNELRQHEKQAAQELGQWTDKQELTGKDGGPQEHEVSHRGVIEVRAVDYRVTAAALRPTEGDAT